MAGSAPPPVFTFRGHKVGVSALVYREPSTLYSGDEEGNIISWDLITFKQLTKLTNVYHSKILDLKLVKLVIGTNQCLDILVIQTRNDGVHLYALDISKELTSFPTYQSLFSRGDALTLIEQNKAVLAYPSALDFHLVTVRYLGNDAQTLLSGSAGRRDDDKRRRESAVFDIHIRVSKSDDFHLFVAYEDGCIAVFSFNQERVTVVPELNVTGLDIAFVYKLDSGISDFVSAYDVMNDNDIYVVVVGSPQNKLIFSEYTTDFCKKDTTSITLKSPGTCTISIRPDHKLVAVANWDSSIRIFSLRTRRHLATLRHHTKQVTAMVFTNREPNQRIMMCCSSLDGTISVFDIFS